MMKLEETLKNMATQMESNVGIKYIQIIIDKKY